MYEADLVALNALIGQTPRGRFQGHASFGSYYEHLAHTNGQDPFDPDERNTYSKLLGDLLREHAASGPEEAAQQFEWEFRVNRSFAPLGLTKASDRFRDDVAGLDSSVDWARLYLLEVLEYAVGYLVEVPGLEFCPGFVGPGYYLTPIGERVEFYVVRFHSAIAGGDMEGVWLNRLMASS